MLKFVMSHVPSSSAQSEIAFAWHKDIVKYKDDPYNQSMHPESVNIIANKCYNK